MKTHESKISNFKDNYKHRKSGSSNAILSKAEESLSRDSQDDPYDVKVATTTIAVKERDSIFGTSDAKKIAVESTNKTSKVTQNQVNRSRARQ